MMGQHYTPKFKQASKEWRRKGEAAPVKVKTRLPAGKVLSTAYYFELWNKVSAAYRRKRRDQPIREVILTAQTYRPAIYICLNRLKKL